MKPAQLMQIIAAPMASIFLILSLCAFRATPSPAAGEYVYLTYAFQSASGFNDCLDDHRLVFRVHSDRSLSINTNVVPIQNLAEITHLILKNQANPEVWLRVDTQVTVKEVASTLDTIHANSPRANVFLVTEHEMDEYSRSTHGFEYIGPAHPENFPYSPSVCTFPEWPRITQQPRLRK